MLRGGLSPRATRAIRLADWAMAIAFAAFAAWRIYGQWPEPDAWAIGSGVVAAAGIFWAAFDWKGRLDARVRASVVRGR